MLITGGTIIGNSTGVHNSGSGTVTFGVKDGIVGNEPLILGNTGFNGTSATFNFYDGTIGGVNTALNATISDTETSSTRHEEQRSINGRNYNITYLEVPIVPDDDEEEFNFKKYL